MAHSLKLIKESLRKVIGDFNFTVEIVAQTTNENLLIRTISGLTGIRKSLRKLEELNLFQLQTELLRQTLIFQTTADTVNIQGAEGARIAGKLEEIKSMIITTLEVLIPNVPEEDPNSVNIKLPPLNDFNDLSKISRDLHLAITQVIYAPEVSGESKILSVENGSIWVNVFVGASALSVLASLFWSGAVVYKKIQEGKILKEALRSLKTKNDSRDEILLAMKEEILIMVEAEAMYLQREHSLSGEAENIERIKNSIFLMAELIGKGAEIHPSLMAPESVSNLFPEISRLPSIESRIKKLNVSEPEKN